MNLTAFVLVLVAACLSAFWNLTATRVAGERISAFGALGIGTVCLGILLLSLRELRYPARSHSWLLAVLVGLTITGYSVVDKLGVELVHPVVYITGLATGTAIFLAPLLL